MGRRAANYQTVRAQMQPGDVIAFSGKSNFSELIKWATRAPVSHVGVILQTKVIIDEAPQKGILNQVIESTTINGVSGVTITRLSDHVRSYAGSIWWLPLSPAARKALDMKRFIDFCLHQEHKPYDTPQAVNSALDTLDQVPLIGNLTWNREDFSKFFCSELVAAALEAGRVIRSINSAEVTPIDLCMFKVYQRDYFQLKGPATRIPGFSTLSPEGWGE